MTAQQWIDRLETAQHRNALDAELKRLERYSLIVIDEIGYVPLERQAANLLFALVARRYERGSIIVTSNRASTPGEILGDQMLAAALIDRLVHHAHIVTLKGKSYRLCPGVLEAVAFGVASQRANARAGHGCRYQLWARGDEHDEVAAFVEDQAAATRGDPLAALGPVVPGRTQEQPVDGALGAGDAVAAFDARVQIARPGRGC